MPKGVVNIRPSLPRMRGDPPLSPTGRAELPRSTPHARGSTGDCRRGDSKGQVYPACAGIHPCGLSSWRRTPRLPRMRGDPPVGDFADKSVDKSTPHARGSTPFVWDVIGIDHVYPACAGIHLNLIKDRENVVSLPRMRGDPPSLCSFLIFANRSTPHARGSTPFRHSI